MHGKKKGLYSRPTSEIDHPVASPDHTVPDEVN
jgi:hypothetical protein